MIFNWLFAENVSEVGISWFDFYSIGHICFGIGLFLFFSLFYTIPKKKGHTPIFSLLFVFICTLIILGLWELFENTLFRAWGSLFKKENLFARCQSQLHCKAGGASPQPIPQSTGNIISPRDVPPASPGSFFYVVSRCLVFFEKRPPCPIKEHDRVFHKRKMIP